MAYSPEVQKVFDDYELFKNNVEKYVTVPRFKFDKSDCSFCYNENTKTTEFHRDITYYCAWMARKLKETNPKKHVDISSQVILFAIMSAYTSIDFYDFRPAIIKLDGLTSSFADITNLPFEDNSINSLSCLSVVEHIGLGRYGDPLDYDGDLKSINELRRVMAPGGNLFFNVPLDNEAKIAFNAGRYYTKCQILEYFNDFDLMEFCIIEKDSEEGIICNPPNDFVFKEKSYTSGCFWFKKKENYEQ